MVMETAFSRMDLVQSPVIPVVGQWIVDSPGTISLGQGVAFYPPPNEVAVAVRESLEQTPLHQYQPVAGIPSLISALTEKLRRDNDINLSSDQAVVVTAGANMGFLNAVLAITEVGDEIILNTPYYFNHEMAVRIAGCQPVLVPTDDQYQLQLDLIAQAIAPRTRAVVTISPNNPTGAIYPEADLRAVNQLCQERGIYHIHDEAYDYFAYDQTPIFSPEAMGDSGGHTISLYSFSKAYGMAGWRVGYMVIPLELLLAVKKIQDTNLICPVVVSQYAALACLRVGKNYSAQFLPEMAACRQQLLETLGQLSDYCRLVVPQGAFYCLLEVNSPLTDLELVKRLIDEFKVAVLPGSTFGVDSGCYLRIAYGALRQATASVAIARLEQGLKSIC
ncbi:aspartate aminotransferase [Synechocystis sp. PCC 6803]|uniref:Aminotransferase n=2 Tax=Synechocystis TaxID=1142 RepID=Q55453_SYNY3|nr:pyridoxal phosphate-dependent aminotransferase [Synechocystis sp. FACHB-898]AGF53087.1 aspartate aminotransferase [Synechocystis sp. PCC 6803]AVP90833.1 pyridoxal phosphate-dependent aminotransferase [Synechocystis sp. IPPAS B-1465]MBD2639166.1 pyridoxal phosphate-dependent aminotransferase [Synechocystis sp. FACHB-908]MBD2660550.1 pyridoxal phosphate-dependent aminotransferase [Synechocystis sp. FACHB-929]BAL30579.1 aspartate aminotransferase [Synechocystis sp. PCC 6803 substr. GT-I]BAL33